jgi:hypothetical protein
MNPDEAALERKRRILAKRFKHDGAPKDGGAGEPMAATSAAALDVSRLASGLSDTIAVTLAPSGGLPQTTTMADTIPLTLGGLPPSATGDGGGHGVPATAPPASPTGRRSVQLTPMDPTALHHDSPQQPGSSPHQPRRPSRGEHAAATAGSPQPSETSTASPKDGVDPGTRPRGAFPADVTAAKGPSSPSMTTGVGSSNAGPAPVPAPAPAPVPASPPASSPAPAPAPAPAIVAATVPIPSPGPSPAPAVEPAPAVRKSVVLVDAPTAAPSAGGVTALVAPPEGKEGGVEDAKADPAPAPGATLKPMPPSTRRATLSQRLRMWETRRKDSQREGDPPAKEEDDDDDEAPTKRWDPLTILTHHRNIVHIRTKFALPWLWRWRLTVFRGSDAAKAAPDEAAQQGRSQRLGSTFGRLRARRLQRQASRDPQQQQAPVVNREAKSDSDSSDDSDGEDLIRIVLEPRHVPAAVMK